MTMSIRLNPEMEQRLATLAKRTGRTRSYYIREAIETHISDMEDIYLAEEELVRLKRGKSRTHSLDEVEKSLGLAD